MSCREQLSSTQSQLNRKTDEYAESVPRRDYDTLLAKHSDVSKLIESLKADLAALEENNKRILSKYLW
jgi:hypothetical protein